MKTHDEMLAILRKAVKGNIAQWCKDNDCGYDAVRTVLCGGRRMPDSIAHKLGYKKSDKYEKL